MKKQKVTITTGELLQANDALIQLMQVEMPLSAGYALRRLINQLGPTMEAAVGSKNALVQKHGEQDQAGSWAIPLNKLAKAKPDLNELDAIPVEVEFEPVTLPGDIKGSVAIIVALEKFVAIATPS